MWGGKDSLAVWDCVEIGYNPTVSTWARIGEYSDNLGRTCPCLCGRTGSPSDRGTLRDAYGYDIPTAAMATRRVPCSSCGTSKRTSSTKRALDGGYTVLVTGHTPRR